MQYENQADGKATGVDLWAGVVTKAPTIVGNAETLFLDNQLCYSLYSASLAMTKVYRPLLKVLGLTYPQYVVMLALWEHDSLSVGELGVRVSLDSGTLVPMLRKLVDAGFVVRQRSETDDRCVLISLTRSGKRLSAHAHVVHARVACVTQCSAEDGKALSVRLNELRAALLSGT